MDAVPVNTDHVTVHQGSASDGMIATSFFISPVCQANFITVLSNVPVTLVKCEMIDVASQDAPGEISQNVLVHSIKSRFVDVASLVYYDDAMVRYRDSQLKFDSSGCFVSTLWCLMFQTAYRVTAVVESGSDSSETVFTASTCSFKTPFSLQRSIQPHFLVDLSTVNRPDFLECLCAQGSANTVFCFTRASELYGDSTCIECLFYHGLFSGIYQQSDFPGSTWLLYMHNEPMRYIIDLHNTFGEPSRSSLVDAVVATEGAYSAPRTSVWRRSSKMKRFLRCQSDYVVAVRSSPDQLEASLRRAKKYHEGRMGETWLHDEQIRMLCHLAVNPQLGVKMLSVELVRRHTGEVLSGCCGFALGSVYHDYTMYTVTRSAEGYGTILTKLVGEALQHCGYDMWYWGCRIGYMSDYEGRYGFVGLSRDEFCERWATSRSELPVWPLDVFLRNGMGMVSIHQDGDDSALAAANGGT